MRKRPLRSRSARTTAVTPWLPRPPSAAEGTTAIGMRCAPAPVISIASCARASAGASSNRIAAMMKRSCRVCVLPLLLCREPILFVLRPEAKFQLPLEEGGVVVLGQRRGLEDGAVDRLVVARVAARLALAHAEHVPTRQQRDVEDRLRIAGQVGGQQDVAADLAADARLPRRQGAAARVGLLPIDEGAQVALLAYRVE